MSAARALAVGAMLGAGVFVAAVLGGPSTVEGSAAMLATLVAAGLLVLGSRPERER